MSKRSGKHSSKQQQPPYQQQQLFDDTSDAYAPSPQYYDPGSHASGQSYGDPYASSAYQPAYQPQYAPTAAPMQQQQQQQVPQHPYQPAAFMPTQLLANPMVNDMAMQYGQQVFGQGSQYVQENLNRYVASSRIKYYFAVDNAYVGKKLLMLMFPYANKNWSLTYSSSGDDQHQQQQQQAIPVAPRFDVNAPDLYIPVMAFVTYILLCGVSLGVRDRFTPEALGVQTSTALVWLLVEILALLLTFYVFNLNSRLRYLDLVAYAGYKYVGMIAIVLSGLFFSSLGFYSALLWCGAALAFFLVRTLNFQIQAADQSTAGHKRRLYMLLFIAGIQPLFMWFLTARVLS